MSKGALIWIGLVLNLAIAVALSYSFANLIWYDWSYNDELAGEICLRETVQWTDTDKEKVVIALAMSEIDESSEVRGIWNTVRKYFDACYNKLRIQESVKWMIIGLIFTLPIGWLSRKWLWGLNRLVTR